MLFSSLTYQQDYYKTRIKLFVALAPVTSLNGIDSNFMKMLNAIKADSLLNVLDIHEFMPDSESTLNLNVFMYNNFSLITNFFMNLTTDKDVKVSNDPNRMKVLYGHYPAGGSLKCLKHYIQIYRHQKFIHYDYGVEANMAIYKQPNPKEYNLNLINNLDIVLVIGKEDRLATVADNQNLKDILKSNCVKYLEIDNFGHTGFVVGREMKWFKEDIVNLMESYKKVKSNQNVENNIENTVNDKEIKRNTSVKNNVENNIENTVNDKEIKRNTSVKNNVENNIESTVNDKEIKRNTSVKNKVENKKELENFKYEKKENNNKSEKKFEIAPLPQIKEEKIETNQNELKNNNQINMNEKDNEVNNKGKNNQKIDKISIEIDDNHFQNIDIPKNKNKKTNQNIEKSIDQINENNEKQSLINKSINSIKSVKENTEVKNNDMNEINITKSIQLNNVKEKILVENKESNEVKEPKINKNININDDNNKLIVEKKNEENLRKSQENNNNEALNENYAFEVKLPSKVEIAENKNSVVSNDNNNNPNIDNKEGGGKKYMHNSFDDSMDSPKHASPKTTKKEEKYKTEGLTKDKEEGDFEDKHNDSIHSKNDANKMTYDINTNIANPNVESKVLKKKNEDNWDSDDEIIEANSKVKAN